VGRSHPPLNSAFSCTFTKCAPAKISADLI
jgi:hypothetical protein